MPRRTEPKIGKFYLGIMSCSLNLKFHLGFKSKDVKIPNQEDLAQSI
jgi:hypothetical protein